MDCSATLPCPSPSPRTCSKLMYIESWEMVKLMSIYVVYLALSGSNPQPAALWALPIPGTCLPKNSLTQELPLLGAQVSLLHHKAFSVSFVSSCLCFLQRQTSLESVLAKMPCLCVHAQSYKTLCNPMDCSLSGSSIYRIFQARILEWVVISFSREFFWSKDRTCTLASPALVGRKGLASWEANKMP